MSDSKEFTTVIGLEIHAQLNTKSKMFCSCDNNAQGKSPNTLTCPICMGMPGTLPVANREAILSVLKLGLILSCKLPKTSKFDRKHYFYPDLPKGYQISQYDMPFCVGGNLLVDEKNVRFNRIHLEEDAGKLTHPKGSKYSVVDLNRAGTPLAEMVTEPDITSPIQAKNFLKELQIILRESGVSDADMEKGQMRCDANISVFKGNESSEIVEIKNLNSFKFVEKALECEQRNLIEKYPTWPQKQNKVTHGFDSNSMSTYAMREKEEAKDYRYFPEPDVPPFDLTGEPFKSEIEKFISFGSSLPSQKRASLEALGITKNDAEVLIKNQRFMALLKDLEETGAISKIAKILINEKTVFELSNEAIIDLAKIISNNQIPSNILRQIIAQAKEENKLPSEIFSAQGKSVELVPVIEKILSKNSDAVVKYTSGKKEIIGFLIGQVMREVQGKANPAEIKNEIEKQLN